MTYTGAAAAAELTTVSVLHRIVFTFMIQRHRHEN